MVAKIGRREMLGTTGAVVAAQVLASGANAGEVSKNRKIIGVCCSPRAGKTTAAALTASLDAAREQDPSVETELIELAGLSIPAQLAAGVPLREGEVDDFPDVAKKLEDPSVIGIVVGSPVYFGTVSALCKAFLDRCIAFRKADFALENKVVGALAVGGSRNGGQELTVQTIQTALMGQNIVIVGTGQPSVRVGATLWNQDDSVEADEYGLGTARDLGRRIVTVAAEMA